MRRPLPFTFEDRTAALTNTDFDDIYDRMFFHVERQPGSSTTKIFEMHFPALRHRGKLPSNSNPLIQLDFASDEHLGTISFFKAPYQSALSMSQYLKKTSFFGSSLSRKFVASDGREYRWGYRLSPGQEWTCTTSDNQLVAHYDLRPPNMRYFDASGNNLVIYESYAHIAPELVASCLIMRHIALYNL
ncbi:hypothetical protein CPB83DRAFT_849820 [Crepidotus variabilis]|uniref:DUF6593 domain-containing protein n=1 Tax=Crepidotus variabilis TaxID=179855 RepID=A0A9P6EL72_9AGAR|nr:hypothetical protein CPB83DRAFT_849820 [Crepidotus variabilis]